MEEELEQHNRILEKRVKERTLEWINKGALPTQTADQLLRKEGVFKA